MVNVPKEIAALGYQQAELRKRIAMQVMAQKMAAQKQRAAMLPDPMAQQQPQQVAPEVQQQQALIQEQAEEAQRQRQAALMQQGIGA
jgi:hypothetical protein